MFLIIFILVFFHFDGLSENYFYYLNLLFLVLFLFFKKKRRKEPNVFSLFFLGTKKTFFKNYNQTVPKISKNLWDQIRMFSMEAIQR